ncbi:MAG TPA: hypothetical protein VFT22_29095 [Kofleriaceae bacterium]|nr:hypothetical protein [Kofleriaceae bacterium]
MARPQTSRRDERRDLTRRALIQWSVAAGAALGVSRSKIFDILERSAGKGVAFAASEHATTRSVHLAAGNGGLSWFQLFWPQVDVARARNPSFAWHQVGMEQDVPGTAQPLVVGPDTPWTSLAAQRQVTCFTCGSNETHTSNGTSTTTLNGSGIFAIATALQASSPCVIPVVTIGDAALGNAPGGATPSNVGKAEGIVDLFNSAASRMGGLLENKADADLFKAHYDAFIQLNRAANRPTTKSAYTTASGAAQFLGTNLAGKLAITDADRARYGITPGTRANVAAIGNAFIITVKAFKMGLTNCVVLPAMRDDPHDAFDSNDVATVPPQLKTVFDAFMADLIKTIDDNTRISLADDTVITIHGDTPKDARDRNGWPDGTAQNTNHVYVYSAGHLKSGWFGSLARDGAVQGFGADGKPATYSGANTAKFATASIAYAIAKRDERAISSFANGVTIGGVFGNLKDA